MLYIAQREVSLDYESLNSFSCPELQKIDNLWVANSKGRFGFSRQKKIWIKTEIPLSIKPEDWTTKERDNYYQFANRVGWYNDKKEWLKYPKLIEGIKTNGKVGTLPVLFDKTFDNSVKPGSAVDAWHWERSYLFSRCDL